jgi:transcriptional regulator of NAD metabolism
MTPIRDRSAVEGLLLILRRYNAQRAEQLTDGSHDSLSDEAIQQVVLDAINNELARS